MKESKPKILVVEDDLSIRRFLKTTLLHAGFQFFETSQGNQVIELVLKHIPDVILLDLGLGDLDGIEIIKKLRTFTKTPIIVLSARLDEKDKITALDLGADDYLTKPFTVGELHARLRVALRHKERLDETETPIFQTDELKVDLVNRFVFLKEKKISLSPIQYSILATLIKRAGKVVTHTQILREVWGETHTEDIDYLRIYIHQLRYKLESNPANPKYLITEPGVGYRLLIH